MHVETNTLRIFMLSRGQGVPEHTRNVYEQIKRLFLNAKSKGILIRLLETRIGLEGETRLCAEFRDCLDVETLLKQIRPLATEVDLLNIDTKKCNQ